MIDAREFVQVTQLPPPCGLKDGGSKLALIAWYAAEGPPVR